METCLLLKCVLDEIYKHKAKVKVRVNFKGGNSTQVQVCAPSLSFSHPHVSPEEREREKFGDENLIWKWIEERERHFHRQSRRMWNEPLCWREKWIRQLNEWPCDNSFTLWHFVIKASRTIYGRGWVIYRMDPACCRTILQMAFSLPSPCALCLSLSLCLWCVQVQVYGLPLLMHSRQVQLAVCTLCTVNTVCSLFTTTTVQSSPVAAIHG